MYNFVHVVDLQNKQMNLNFVPNCKASTTSVYQPIYTLKQSLT